MIDIALLIFNRKRITEISIREIHARTTTPHRLIILDNGSTDGTPRLLAELQDEGVIDTLVTSSTNQGVHWGHNTLLDLVQTDLYVSTDNDIVPQAPTEEGDWLSLLLGLLPEDYAALSLLSHALIGDNLNAWTLHPEPIIERGWCGASLRLMRTEAVRDAGGWRKTTDPSRNNEERWICKRLKEAGWKVGFSRDIRNIHLWGEPELGEDEWGYKPGSEHGHRPVWPPPSRSNWDRKGIDWNTCKPGGTST